MPKKMGFFERLIGLGAAQVEVPSGPNVITSAATVPTVFADTVLFAYAYGTTVRLQFVENHVEAANSTYPGLKSRHVVNLVMPVEGFHNMLGYLNSISETYFPKVAEAALEQATEAMKDSTDAK